MCQYMDSPRILIQALLLGPLEAGPVENFARNRNDTFREATKKMLLDAEQLTDKEELEKFLEAHKIKAEEIDFIVFKERLANLMKELRRGKNTFQGFSLQL